MDFGGRHRPRFDEANMLRGLEARYFPAAEIEHVRRADGGARRQLDERDRHFAIMIIRDTDDLSQSDLRMRAEVGFHFQRRDILAADLELIFQPTAKGQKAIGTELSAIAGVKV